MPNSLGARRSLQFRRANPNRYGGILPSEVYFIFLLITRWERREGRGTPQRNYLVSQSHPSPRFVRDYPRLNDLHRV